MSASLSMNSYFVFMAKPCSEAVLNPISAASSIIKNAMNAINSVISTLHVFAA